MGKFLGMDTVSIRELSEMVSLTAEELQRRLDVLHGVTSASSAFWVGADGDRFRAEYTSLVDNPGQLLTSALSRSAGELELEAEQQDTASEADAGTASAGSAGGNATDPLLASPPAPVDGPPDGNPTYDPYIEQVWNNPNHPDYMDEDERRRFLEQMVREELERQGIDDVQFAYPPVRDPETGDLNNYGGYWSDETEPPTLAIREDQLGSTYALTIALHEIRHGIQYEMIDRTVAFHNWGFWDHVLATPGSVLSEVYRSDQAFESVEEEYGFTREEIEQWNDEFNDYVGIPDELPEDASPQERQAYEEQMEQYRSQAVEVDARTFAYEQGSQLTPEQFREIRERS